MRSVDVMSSLAVGEGSDSSIVSNLVFRFVGSAADGGGDRNGRPREDQSIEGILILSSIPSTV